MYSIKFDEKLEASLSVHAAAKSIVVLKKVSVI